VTIVEWDEHKAAGNLAKHHVSFELAATAFDDPFAMIFTDSEHSDDEHREKLLGLSDKGVLVVVFVSRFRRERIVRRIISARKANRREQVLYAQNR
jgi:uncharacterized DUF497 family protein